jgi:hypothetical protein
MISELNSGLVTALNLWAARLLKGDILVIRDGSGHTCRLSFVRDGVERAFPAYSLFLLPETLQLDEHTGRATYTASDVIESEFEIPAKKPKTKPKKA